MQGSETTEVAVQIRKLTDAIEDKVKGWYEDLHSHPELPNREFRTAGIIAEHLRSLDLDEVRTDVDGTAVVAVLRGRKPGGTRVMGLRADIDALPIKELAPVSFASTVVDQDYPGGPFPVSHACGHDAHAAMLMGAAEVLSQLRDELSGTVVFLFQPAEEGPPLGEDGGALNMINNGAIADPKPDMIFGMHVVPLPAGELAYAVGPGFAASEVVKIVVHGQGVHGSTPWMGKDPLPTIASIITGSAQIYRQIPTSEMMTISFGHVEDTGRFNVISDTITLLGTVRAIRQEVLESINQKLTDLAHHSAELAGCTAEIEFLQQVPPVINTQEWIDRTLPTATRVMGDGNVKRFGPVMGYDDVSEFINAVGGVYLLLGCQDTDYDEANSLPSPTPGGRGLWPNHNPHFYVEESVLAIGVRLHANMTFDFLAGSI